MFILKGKDFVYRKVLFLLCVFLSLSSSAQTVSKISCLVPYEINMAKDDAGPVDKDIYYESHDDHPFWYRINFEDNMKVNYQITSLDENSNFDIYLYQYDGNQFCKMFINNNLELISFERSLDYKSSKGSSYYLGIYPISPGGCGHKITLESEDKYVSLTANNLRVKCGMGEIVENPDNITAKGNVILKGHVGDRLTGNKINARISLIDPFTGHKQDVYSNDKSGFEVGLKEDGDYKVQISAFGYEELISATAAYDGDYVVFTLEASAEMNYVLNNVYFYPNTFALKDESIEELESVYSFIQNHPDLHMLIKGHTNGNKDIKASRFVKETGEEWNFTGTAKELSQKRAEKIVEFLVNKGIDEIRLEAIGKGGDEMIIQNPSSLKDAMKNIRVEILIVHQE